MLADSDDDAARLRAVEDLALTRSPLAVPALRDAVGVDLVGRHAAAALCRMSDPPSTLAFAMPRGLELHDAATFWLLEGVYGDERWVIVDPDVVGDWLRAHVRPVHVAGLSDLAVDGSGRQRSVALDLLAEVAATGAMRTDDDAATALLALLRTDDARCRIVAARVLDSYLHLDVPDALLDAVDDPESEVRAGL